MWTPIARFVTRTNLVLILTIDKVRHLNDLRPISLCNFVNKVLSRLIWDRISPLIPRIISKNQSGFVKGRNITENVLLPTKLLEILAEGTNFTMLW